MIVNLIVMSVITTTVLAAMAGVVRKSELEIVDAVDLSRYAGRWYEIEWELNVRDLSSGRS